MITMMMSINPSDMALSPTAAGGWKSAAPRHKRKAYPGLWFQHRNRGRLFRLQFQRRRIDAVAQPGRAGAVLEHVPEMAIAFRAQHLGPDHAVADVALLVDMALCR